MKNELAVVVVTYNRLEWLKKNLDSLKNQTKKINKIFIIDNNSTDGTVEFLKRLKIDSIDIECVYLQKNIGGAGGFYTGLKIANEQNYEWISLMDDDCILDENCYNVLFDRDLEKKDAYIPMRYSFENPNEIIGEKKLKKLENQDEFIVENAPFNAFTISSELVKKIGLPEKEYFIYGDDDEYCYRIRKNNGKIKIIKNTKLYHPNKIENPKKILFLKYTPADFSNLRNYYCVRNTILNNQKYPNLELPKTNIKSIFKMVIKQCLIGRINGARLVLKGYIDGKNGVKKSLGKV